MKGAIGGLGGRTDALASPRSAPPQAAPRWIRLTGLLGRGPNAPTVALCALIAAALDALQLSRPGYLLGGTADISVYLGTAVRLIHGVLPYRDFVVVQPPGSTLLLSPAALLSELVGTRWALAMLRLGTILVASANVVLVGRLVRHHGRLQTLVACGVMAILPAELYALNAGLLEPLVDLFCLLGAAIVFDRGAPSASWRRWLAGGAALGFGIAVKLPAVVPALVLGAACLPDIRRRLVPFGGGVVAGFAVPSAALFAPAPGPFFRDVVVGQLGRVPDSSRASVATRLAGMTLGGGGNAAVAITLALFAVTVLGLAVRGRRRDTSEWFTIASVLLVAGVQFVPSQYYPQYAALLAPFLAMSLASAVDRLTALLWRPVVALAVVTAFLAVALAGQVVAIEASSVSDPAAAVDAVVPPGGCTLSDGPRVLVPSDRFVSTAPGCTEMVDPFGTMLTFAGDPGAGVAVFRAAIAHADYLVLTGGVADWLSGPYTPLQAQVTGDFHLVRSGDLWIYVRDGSPAVGGGR
jgi:alpha-1,2-mannosyltransferase